MCTVCIEEKCFYFCLFSFKDKQLSVRTLMATCPETSVRQGNISNVLL